MRGKLLYKTHIPAAQSSVQRTEMKTFSYPVNCINIESDFWHAAELPSTICVCGAQTSIA